MQTRERWGVLERLRKVFGLGDDRRASPPLPRPPREVGWQSGCEQVPEVSSEGAARRVYACLDGELEEDAEAIRCHVEQCQRCYPMYDWERMFLDILKERARRPEPSEELPRRVAELLDCETG